MHARLAVLPLLLTLASCGPAAPPPSQAPSLPAPTSTAEPQPKGPGPVEPRAACRPGPPMRVHFYDAGQALAVLLTLPDGRHVLIDAGESPRRPCAGCKAWHERVMAGLHADLGPSQLHLLWITHQHSDHVGGAADVLEAFPTKLY